MRHLFGTDWDEPSPDNSILCDRFGYGTIRQPVEVSYRLFVPQTDVMVPLVVFLHGADAYGTDNEEHLAMHDIGTAFVRDEWQEKHPCYVAAPQCRPGDHWANPRKNNGVCSLIDELINRYGNIDPARVYIYGYSAGGVGVLGLIKDHPDLFAAAVSICGATSWEHTDELLRVPLWLLHAADDEIVRPTYYQNSNPDGAVLGSSDLYEKLKDRHHDLHYTEYPVGYMMEHFGVNPHCSWVPAGRDERVKEWLFIHHLPEKTG